MSEETEIWDFVVVGGGIVGLATAYQLTELDPSRRVLVLEKEPQLAQHQTGHNSGVLHSGIYYKPGSLKAVNCREGKLAMEAFCRTHEIPHEICGKVIVAVDDSELARLDSIFERGQANGVQCELIGKQQLAELEPHAAGVRAIHVPEAGIVNYGQVCQKLGELLLERDGQLVTGSKVTGIRQTGDELVFESTTGSYRAKHGVNCSGLHSDRVARLAGAKPKAKIVPFRGEYYELSEASRDLVRNLIYPVPDPSFPFLGVHFTRMIDGSVECGPNAVLAFAREGYRKRDVNLRDLFESLTYGGFLRLAAKHWQMGMGEMWRSFSKRAFVKALQRLIPEIRSEHLVPARAGVRAQAISPSGAMVDDFSIVDDGHMVHVTNAPSPAATSSLNIGRLVAESFADH